MRKPSNSITELVKTVANEEIDKRVEQLVTRQVIDASVFIDSIVSAVSKAGTPWTTEEDDLLIQEVKAAIAVIAKNHSRSIGAMKARITQKQLTLG